MIEDDRPSRVKQTHEKKKFSIPLISYSNLNLNDELSSARTRTLDRERERETQETRKNQSRNNKFTSNLIKDTLKTRFD